mgnify:CR=1 FL=1
MTVKRKTKAAGYFKPPQCVECANTASLVGGALIYPHRDDLHDRWFWLCECGAYCGTHRGTQKPLGTPAGRETRQARMAAHNAFDPLWKVGKRMSRMEAYGWLATVTGIPHHKCHIGMMTKAQAMRVVQVCHERRQNEGA